MISSQEAKAEVFWTAFQSMSKRERDAVIMRFLEDEEFKEELIDTVLLKLREDEPSRPLSEYLAEKENQ